MSEQRPIDDETLWGEPGREAQNGTDAILPAEVEEIQKEAEIKEQLKRNSN